MTVDQTSWIELSVEVHREAVEPVTEIFARYGYDQGVALDEPFQQDRDGDNLRVDPAATVKIRTWVAAAEFTDARRLEIFQALSYLGQIMPVGDLTAEPVESADWTEAWKEHFRPVRAGYRVVVRPPWFHYEPVGDDLVIVLDPGMAFGAGTHPTTRLALQGVERTVKSGDRVLDVGSGSGILAIAAAKLGASQVDAVEIDPVSARQSLLNIELNGMADRIEMETGSLDGASRFAAQIYDVTVANIIARILIELAPRLSASVRRDGQLILSGIIDSKEAEVISTFAAIGMEIASRTQDEDWISQVWKHQG